MNKCSTRCYTLTPSFIWTVNKKKYQEMQINHPLIFLEFQKILLLSLSVSHISTGFQLHPSTAYHIVFKKQPTVPAQLEMQYPPEIPNVFSPYMFHSP